MKVQFLDLPQIKPYYSDEDGELWELTDAFHAMVDGVPITVPAGFVTDGASIPRILWRVCGHPMSTKRLPAAVLHDWLYYSITDFTRAEADQAYRDGLINLGFPRWKATLEYYALRLFGGAHYARE